MYTTKCVSLILKCVSLILLYSCHIFIVCPSYCYIRVLTLLYMWTSGTTICVLIPLYVCPSYCYIRVLLLYVSSCYNICVLMLLHVSSCYYICVLMPHATIYVDLRIGTVSHNLLHIKMAQVLPSLLLSVPLMSLALLVQKCKY